MLLFWFFLNGILSFMFLFFTSLVFQGENFYILGMIASGILIIWNIKKMIRGLK